MSPIKKEFTIDAPVLGLFFGLLIVITASMPFMIQGYHGSDSGGTIGIIGGAISFILLLVLLPRLKLWWLSSRLGLRLRVESEEERLKLAVSVNPRWSGALSLLAFELTSLEWVGDQTKSRPSQTWGQRSLPLKVGERSVFEAAISLPKRSLWYKVDLYLRIPAWRAVRLEFYLRGDLSSGNANRSLEVICPSPLRESALLSEAPQEDSSAPYRGERYDASRVALALFSEGDTATKEARSQRGLALFGTVFYSLAFFFGAVFLIARELDSGGAVVLSALSLLGAFFYIVSAAHSSGGFLALLFGLFFLIESQLLYGLRPYSSAEVQFGWLCLGLVFMIVALWHGVLLWRSRRS